VGARHAPDGAPAAPGAGVGARQADVRAGLVDEDEGGRVEGGGLRPPGGARGLVALGGDQRLFLSS
jgi:hypothetical protein